MFRKNARDAGIKFRFKSQQSEEQRIEESRAVLEKYPHRLPVIVERAPNSNQVPAIDKQKVLVPDDIAVAQFMWIVRRRIALSPERALFLFVGRVMPPSSMSMGELYAQYKDDDGFLYLTYSGENTFGA
ncbi:gamma-aminobutyric acid receptor-associated protein-like 2 [Galendromus occidentalis]|uniref:Gamma-aminobutyric acid receptor-associated protein-like 2 n=1 Tax=Galendromus occidentalis TaxID=34638 RepID=A0AAJ6QSH1_9ACAR|nr:gamma-aminobutyric acid receptor-associated protein-like 2 [Galendromus occidentalis]